MSRMTVLVTGGTSGLGKQAALELAKGGAHVLLVGRDLGRGREAEADLRARAGHDRVEFLAGDVSVFAEVRRLAGLVRTRFEHLDALVLSAGVIPNRRETTVDGQESIFATNFLARFLFVAELQPLLDAAKAPRIVLVGAKLGPGARVHFDDVTLAHGFSVPKAMFQAMYANHLFVQAYAKRHAGRPTIAILHPGVVQTNIMRHAPWWMRAAAPLMPLLATPVERAAVNIVKLASSPDADGLTGHFWPDPARFDRHEAVSLDADAASRLWTLAEQVTAPRD